MTIGPLVDAGALEERFLEVLPVALPPYLAATAVAAGKPAGYLPGIKTWSVVSEHDRFPEEGLPCVIIGAPGITGEPTKDGEGNWTAIWAFEVSVTATGRDAREARRRAQLFAAAVRACLLQTKISAPNFKASVLAWLDEAYTDVPTTKRRSILATSNVFSVEVEDVVNEYGRPGDPNPPITEVDVEVDIP